MDPLKTVVEAILNQTVPLPPLSTQRERPEQAHNGAGCPACNWQGWYTLDVPTSDKRFGRAFPCECQAEVLSARLQAASNLTADERKHRLSRINTENRPGTKEMVAAARAFVHNPNGILTLWGGVGNAKTVVLQAIVNECVSVGVPAVYVTFRELLDWIQESYEPGHSESAMTRKDRVATIRVLAIDEMDKVKKTEWVNEFQSDVLDKRYRLGLSGEAGTVLAMNKSPEEMPEWIASRLNDGRNKTIQNQDPDLRPMME